MTDRELLQEALDVIIAAIKSGDWKVDGACDPDFVINALRARLSQPEPEPVAWGLQQQFEGKIGTAPVAFKRHDEFGFVVPLYTAPPQREWVGLTDEDIEDCLEMSIQGTCRAIEAKLKEKNG